MKKFMLLAVAGLVVFYAPTAQALAYFNQQSYDKMNALSLTLDKFVKDYENAELTKLAQEAEAVRAKASALVAYDIASEAPGDQTYAEAASKVKAAARSVETVSKKMAEAATAEDEQLFVTYEAEFNKAVKDFKSAGEAYGKAIDVVNQRAQFEQLLYIGLVVLTGLITIATWLWAFAKRAVSAERAKARKRVAVASLAPFVGAIITLVTYFLAFGTSPYLAWGVPGAGAVILIVAFYLYLYRRKQFAGARTQPPTSL